MAYTRATKQKRLDSLGEQIRLAADAAEVHARRAGAARERVGRLTQERDWLAQAPVSDPLPEEGGAK
jgi:hypothetical protein